MSALSREVASWIRTNPGPVYAYTEEVLWSQVISKFRQDRRWKGDIILPDFMLYMTNCGYRVETRPNMSKNGGPEHFFILALPEPHRGF